MSGVARTPRRPGAPAAGRAAPRGGRVAPARPPLAVAAACLALAAILYALALGVDDLLMIDRDLRFPQVVGDWRLRDDASRRFSQATGSAFAVGGALLLLGTLGLGGVRRAAVVAAVVGAGPLAAWAIAAALGAIDPVGGEALRTSRGAFPSGHAAAAFSLGLGLAIAVPPRGRAAAGALGVAFASAVAVGVMALGWHYPSDVLGALLVSTAAAAVVLAFAPRSGRSPVVRSGASWAPPVALLAGALLVCGVTAAVALDRLPDESAGAFVDAHPGFVAAATACVLLSTAGAAALLRLCGAGRVKAS